MTIDVNGTQRTMTNKIIDDSFGWTSFADALTDTARIRVEFIDERVGFFHYDGARYLGCQIFDFHLAGPEGCDKLETAVAHSDLSALLPMLTAAQRATTNAKVQRAAAKMLRALTPRADAATTSPPNKRPRGLAAASALPAPPAPPPAHACAATGGGAGSAPRAAGGGAARPAPTPTSPARPEDPTAGGSPRGE
jgi:hypothetical protein